jgi:hypothetical protein
LLSWAQYCVPINIVRSWVEGNPEKINSVANAELAIGAYIHDADSQECASDWSDHAARSWVGECFIWEEDFPSVSLFHRNWWWHGGIFIIQVLGWREVGADKVA